MTNLSVLRVQRKAWTLKTVKMRKWITEKLLVALDVFPNLFTGGIFDFDLENLVFEVGT